MEIQTLYLEKKTGTHADALAAFGLAHLAYLLSGEQPHIQDAGWCYEVSWPSGPQDTGALAYENVRLDPGYRYVMLKDGDPAAPSARIDYGEQRQRLLVWRKMRDDLRKANNGRLSEEDRERLQDAEPMENWGLFQNLNVLQALGSYNALHAEVRASDRASFAGAIQAKLAALAMQQDASEAASSLDLKVSAVQAFNPTVGKGTNRPKPDGPALSGLPTAYVDWFEEWLRFIGIDRAARTINIGDNIKMIVMAPGELSGSASAVVRQALLGEPAAWTSAKADILSVLGLARTLVECSGLLESGSAELADLFADPNVTPRHIVAGLHIAYFTSLGSARALTNIGFVGLPAWFPVTRDTAEDWIDILQEHHAVLRLLDEEKSEEADLMLQYRDFLSAGSQDIRSLLRFFGSFAVHVMRTRARSKPVRQFTITNLRRLVEHMSANFSAILASDGFQAVATAMRRATVTEQFWKSQGHQVYEIQYGLFAEIRRKAEFPRQLVAAIGDFINRYNAENARGEEQARSSGRRLHHHRARVTNEQLTDLVRLLDTYPSEVVAMLLLASASSRDARATEADTNDETQSEPAETAV